MKAEKMNIKYETDLMSQKAFDAHITLYNNYVDNVNKNLDVLTLDSYSVNGKLLHELFFENIGYESQPTDEVITNLFNSSKNVYNIWKAEFIDLCMKVQSKGWIAIVWNNLTKMNKNVVMTSHNEGLPLHCEIILINDLYEHNYWYDYQSNKKEYIEKFISRINWDVVNNRVKKAKEL